MKSAWALAMLLSISIVGCQSQQSRLNAPPHGEEAEKPDLQGTYVYMADNALLESMSVSDYHFLPNRDRLTTLGKQRLYRLAALIEEYGGAIRYNSLLGHDDPLVTKRTTAIVNYLTELGVDTRNRTISREPLAESTSKSAEEAILIRVNEGTYKPKKSSSSSAMGGGMTGTSMTGGSN